MSFVAGAITASLELVHLQYDQAILKAIDEARQFKSEADDLGEHLDKAGHAADSSGGAIQNWTKNIINATGDSEALQGAMEFMGKGIEEASAAAEEAGPLVAGLGLIIAGVVYSAYELVRGTKEIVGEITELQSHIHELSENVGVSTEEFSKFSFAASLFGVNADEAAESFKFLGRNVFEATQGKSEAVEIFNKFGIAFEDASGHARPLADVMFDLSDALHGAAPGAERTGIAMELLGRAGTGMVSTLSQGSAALREQMGLADQFGVTVSDATGEAAHGFEILLHEVEAAWEGIKMMLGNELRIAVQPELEKLVDWIKTHSKEIHTIVQGIADAAVWSLHLIISALESLASLLETRVGRALAGAAVGFALLGPVGAAGGFSAGLSSADPSRSSTTINVSPVDASSSTSQLANSLQQAIRQSRQQMQTDMDITSRRMAIENGI